MRSLLLAGTAGLFLALGAASAYAVPPNSPYATMTPSDNSQAYSDDAYYDRGQVYSGRGEVYSDPGYDYDGGPVAGRAAYMDPGYGDYGYGDPGYVDPGYAYYGYPAPVVGGFSFGGGHGWRHGGGHWHHR
jgi:hypothetical protein